jgi:hypothetical protein
MRPPHIDIRLGYAESGGIDALTINVTGQRNLILFIGEHSEPVNRIKLRCPVTILYPNPVIQFNLVEPLKFVLGIIAFE